MLRIKPMKNLLAKLRDAACLLMTVPPYLARTPKELLLPREVIERDQRIKGDDE